jgi:hypothetical protein
MAYWSIGRKTGFIYSDNWISDANSIPVFLLEKLYLSHFMDDLDGKYFAKPESKYE